MRVGNRSGEWGAVEGSEQAEVAEEEFPECELVVRAFVEIGGHTVGVGEERAGFAGADETETLTAAGQPSLEIAAEGIGEEEPHVGVLMAEAAEKEIVAEALGWEGEGPVGDSPALEEREELIFSDEGDLGVGATGAEGAEEGQGHDDVAEPIGEADVDARAVGEPGKAAGEEVGGEQVAFRFEAEAFLRHVLIAPAVVGPKPRGAEVVVGGEELFEPTVEAEGDGEGFAAGGDELHTHLDAPESATAWKNTVDAGVEFLGHETGEFGRGTDAAEERGERALEAGVLVEEDADEALAAEDFQGVGEAFFAREELHAEALAGGFDESVGGGVVERAEDDAEFGERAGDDERLRGLGLPVGEVRGTDKRRGGGSAVERVSGEQLGGGGDDLAEAGLVEVGCGEGEKTCLDHAVAALASDGAMPRGGFFGERVVEVGKDEATAAREAKEDEIPEGGRESAQERFGSVSEEPAEKFEEKKQHADERAGFGV